MPESAEFTIDLTVVVACTRCGKRWDLTGIRELPADANVLDVFQEIDGCPGCDGGDGIPAVTAAE